MSVSKRIITFLCSFAIVISSVSFSFVAHANIFEDGEILDDIWTWLSGGTSDGGATDRDYEFEVVTPIGSASFSSTLPQKYYTTPTESVEDKYGNVTNYYRGGDTTTTKIIDSYNHTFNTIHNTTNNTNNYTANVKLSDFLNSYTTNTNNYTYNTEYKSWYYDNTSNTMNYDASQTYYNTDNSRYYISIDNSTDEYYLVDVQYSPTFVTVNYTYNNIDNSVTNNVTNNYGNVTNVYYYELADGRNSYTLSVDEVAGLALAYDVVNYELVIDDPNTLSLQHFDGDYTDSSSYGNEFYSVNRSTTYVDSGEFGEALKLPSGSAAGVTIPGLSDHESLTIDFRIYYDDISSLGIYLGEKSLFEEVFESRRWVGADNYSDDGSYFYQEDAGGAYSDDIYTRYEGYVRGGRYTYDFVVDNLMYDYDVCLLSTTFKSKFSVPTSYLSDGYESEDNKKYGWMDYSSDVPELISSNLYEDVIIQNLYKTSGGSGYYYWFNGILDHCITYEYEWSPTGYVAADFSYSTYVNQWVSMRLTIKDGKLYYFVNGDLVGSGDFTMPTADKFYIKSAGTLYLDELRITTGDMVSTETYTPSSAPFDTNKVLALPSELTANTIYVRHSTPVNGWRIGGVRPSNPTTGFFYLPLHSDYTGGQAQLYDGSNWVDVDAMVYDGTSVTSVVGFTFTPMGESTDVNTDLKEPGIEDESGCSHTWEETARTDATCSGAGSVTYTCSECEAVKTEKLAKLDHTWEVKQSVQTTYDEAGNILTEGFTIYRCTACGEEYKDTDGSGPPMSDPSDDSGDGNWFTELLEKIGDFFGTTIGGLLSLIGTVIINLLDSLISLVSSALARLTEVVDLFGSFGDAIGSLWSWLPPEIVTVLVAGVTVVVFVAVIKLFI